jgi:hypothetical protein
VRLPPGTTCTRICTKPGQYRWAWCPEAAAQSVSMQAHRACASGAYTHSTKKTCLQFPVAEQHESRPVARNLICRPTPFRCTSWPRSCPAMPGRWRGCSSDASAHCYESVAPRRRHCWNLLCAFAEISAAASEDLRRSCMGLMFVTYPAPLATLCVQRPRGKEGEL